MGAPRRLLSPLTLAAESHPALIHSTNVPIVPRAWCWMWPPSCVIGQLLVAVRRCAGGARPLRPGCELSHASLPAHPQPPTRAQPASQYSSLSCLAVGIQWSQYLGWGVVQRHKSILSGQLKHAPQYCVIWTGAVVAVKLSSLTRWLRRAENLLPGPFALVNALQLNVTVVTGSALRTGESGPTMRQPCERRQPQHVAGMDWTRLLSKTRSARRRRRQTNCSLPIRPPLPPAKPLSLPRHQSSLHVTVHPSFRRTSPRALDSEQHCLSHLYHH
ncbi:hypothetical protein IQ07DRAFT_392130 [Pyrenochaeta sp. DS3sAY3a]|nr:hypothetical protein IQ07DRAFT_392130 [Pyrenochaeta sp. DS3sAY3a]